MSNGSRTPAGRPTLRVNDIGEFIRFSSCLRRAKLAFNKKALARSLPFYGRLENTLDVLLQEKGSAIERAWERDLITAGYTNLGRGTSEAPLAIDDLLARLATCPPNTPAFAREISIHGRIGTFEVEGRIDFVLVLWREGRPVLRIVEGKASRKDRTYQRLQVAAYVMVVRHLAAARLITISGIRIDAIDVEGVVARIDDQLRRPQDFVSLEALDLTAPIEDLERLLAPDGPFDRAFLANLDDLPYALEPKCDACVFGVHCLPETARQRRIELIGASPGTVAALRAEGVGSLDALATLDIGGDLAAALRANDAVDEDIEHLAIRARARLMTLPGGDDIEGYRVEALPRSGLSQLPPHEIEGRRLVRIYMVVDYDYVEDRIASVSAHITASDHELRTPFMQDASGRWRPAARVIEVPSAPAGDAPPTERGISGRTIIRIKAGAWTGDCRPSALVGQNELIA